MSNQHYTVTFTTPDAAEQFAASLREHGADSAARVASERVVLFTSWATANTVNALAFKFDTQAVTGTPLPVDVGPSNCKPTREYANGFERACTEFGEAFIAPVALWVWKFRPARYVLSSTVGAVVVVGFVVLLGYAINQPPDTTPTRSNITPGELQTDIGSPAACSGIETDISEMTAFEKRAWLALDC